MGFFVTENYEELQIWVRMATNETTQLWEESYMMIDLWFTEYRNSCRDNIILYAGDCRWNWSWD